MKLRSLLAACLFSALAAGPLQFLTNPEVQAVSYSIIQAPVLKWQLGGCYSSWCETGWYSSPAVADLEGDGKMEVIGSAYSIVALDGATGALKWRVASGHDRSEPGASSIGRTWPGIAVADVDRDGSLEIITAHGGGTVSVYNNQGYLEPGWPQQPTPGSELRSLAVYDLDGDGDLEILTASTRSENQWFAFEHDGSLRPSYWPQHSPDSNANGYTAGCYNQNIAVGDLDGDSRAEIIGPNDTHYLAAYNDNGSQLRANSMFGKNPDGTDKYWSRVGVHVDQAVDLRGYANCGVEHRPNFANSAPLIVDVNGDGVQEVVVIGNVYNCGTDPYSDLYEIPYILKGDRTRWSAGGYDWTVLPAPEAHAAPLSEDYNQIENSLPNPAAADLDGDGNLEILYPSYDGRLHAYWLDKTEHGNWPFSVYNSAEGFYRFATEPVVADLDNNGKAEVIFASWTQKGSNHNGKLYILDYLGNLIQETPLPPGLGDTVWDGALAAPTLADIDGDQELEIVLNTAHTGLVAYDLPGTSGARLLWGTGRGSYQRSGSIVEGNLNGSVIQVSKGFAFAGDTLTYTILLRNPGPPLGNVQITDALPTGLSFVGNLWASAGTAQESGGIITWSGAVGPGPGVSIRFEARISEDMLTAQPIMNSIEIEDGQGGRLQRQVVTLINGVGVYLPWLSR